MADIRGRSISERLGCKAVDPVAGNFHFGDQLSCCCVGHAFRIFVTISGPGNKESFCEFGKRLYGPEEAVPSYSWNGSWRVCQSVWTGWNPLSYTFLWR